MFGCGMIKNNVEGFISYFVFEYNHVKLRVVWIINLIIEIDFKINNYSKIFLETKSSILWWICVLKIVVEW